MAYNRMTKEEFIEKAQRVHAGENIDYSQVEYVNNRTRVKLIDPEYGEFWQTPSNHLKGQQHPKRKGSRISKTKAVEEDEVIRRFMEVHNGENLDYSKVHYVNMHTKVCIIDPEYGEFWQEPVVHLKGCGHPERGAKKSHDTQRYTTEEFVSLAKQVHSNDDFDYSLVDYVNSKTKVTIICNKSNNKGVIHGPFRTNPDLFLQGKGCPKCGYHLSYGEDEVAELISNDFGIPVIVHDKTILHGKEIDILIPSHNIGIEYNGLRWHVEKFGKDRHYHLDKTERCLENGIRLIQIFEDEWKTRKRMVIDKLKTILGVQDNIEKIHARKCEIRIISNSESRDFLENNHIQGYVASSVAIGAFYDNRLVGVMTFTISSTDRWVLSRYATQIGTLCSGLASKMLKFFINQYNPYEIKSFADRRWTVLPDNNMYTKIGFVLDGIVGPDYKYYCSEMDILKRYHKFGFRKQHLSKKYGFPMSMTEGEMTSELGCDKVWDCGLWRYVWRKP